jgi:hypothetical protein
MGARPIIFKSSLWLKWALLLASWILSFLILIIVSTNNKLNTLYNDAVSRGPEFRLPKNQIGALSYTRSDPEENHRPIYSVAFKNLRVENNTLGIFETALHKVVKIRDLELRFYRYPPPKVTTTTELNHSKSLKTTVAGSSQPCTTTIPDILFIPEDITADARALIKNIIRKLITSVDGWRVNIDFGNVSEVRVNNFHYKVFYDDDLFFAIQSKRAIVSYKQSGVVLRGHVTIKSADGSTLESNHIMWDVKKQHFSVNGLYTLNRGGIKTMGKDICVDAQLNNVKVKRAEFKQKEDQKCLAKL